MKQKFFVVDAGEFERLVNSGEMAGYDLASWTMIADDAKVAAVFENSSETNPEADSSYWDSFPQTAT